MELKLYNTLTRKKAPFVPIDPKNVRMYACGPTVYDYAHIGNARPVIVFDVLYRLLRSVYGVEHVTYVRNITDVDDKINARAAEEYPDIEINAAVAEVTSRTTEQFHEDIAALGVLPPDVEPTCTSHIPQMVEMIGVLIAKGFAYEAEGHVLLDTASVPNYGNLSGRSLDEMIAGARVEVAPYKRNPADSVLWKPSDDSLPGWPSPWGRGRPGWHIECSAMAKAHLGDVFDIHGGGIDLTFPHHENELAQSCCANGTDMMARVWMHNGFLQVEGEKMSKSLGNFVTINQLLQDWPGEVLRFNMLRTHYRQPIDWTVKGLEETAKTLTGFYGGEDFSELEGSFAEPVLEALADDMNSPAAITVLHQLDRAGDRDALLSSLRALGFAGDLTDPRAKGVDEAAIQVQIEQRLAARAAKDFAEADRIRDELAAQGIALKDGPDGTTWELAR
ncbi:MAG: cysteine--tRNA ligase [Pseudomonadota bacterium]